eukprot:TRINITY_DN36701_c0_g1_i1.p1 TRINITY_DN36701_c0_g1~~TRINITY_DN36701_c0_g1_i1.p1  ORF type:complete len:758 (-),score=154.12 TRINITY_DN36701_c0_g1_i1:61-2334(-)
MNGHFFAMLQEERNERKAGEAALRQDLAELRQSMLSFVATLEQQVATVRGRSEEDGKRAAALAVEAEQRADTAERQLEGLLRSARDFELFKASAEARELETEARRCDDLEALVSEKFSTLDHAIRQIEQSSTQTMCHVQAVAGAVAAMQRHAIERQSQASPGFQPATSAGSPRLPQAPRDLAATFALPMSVASTTPGSSSAVASAAASAAASATGMGPSEAAPTDVVVATLGDAKASCGMGIESLASTLEATIPPWSSTSCLGQLTAQATASRGAVNPDPLSDSRASQRTMSPTGAAAWRSLYAGVPPGEDACNGLAGGALATTDVVMAASAAASWALAAAGAAAEPTWRREGSQPTPPVVSAAANAATVAGALEGSPSTPAGCPRPLQTTSPARDWTTPRAVPKRRASAATPCQSQRASAAPALDGRAALPAAPTLVATAPNGRLCAGWGGAVSSVQAAATSYGGVNGCSTVASSGGALTAASASNNLRPQPVNNLMAGGGPGPGSYGIGFCSGGGGDGTLTSRPAVARRSSAPAGRERRPAAPRTASTSRLSQPGPLLVGRGSACVSTVDEALQPCSLSVPAPAQVSGVLHRGHPQTTCVAPSGSRLPSPPAGTQEATALPATTMQAMPHSVVGGACWATRAAQQQPSGGGAAQMATGGNANSDPAQAQSRSLSVPAQMRRQAEPLMHGRQGGVLVRAGNVPAGGSAAAMSCGAHAAMAAGPVVPRSWISSGGNSQLVPGSICDATPRVTFFLGS